jgi:hypothetical protein
MSIILKIGDFVLREDTEGSSLTGPAGEVKLPKSSFSVLRILAETQRADRDRRVADYAIASKAKLSVGGVHNAVGRIRRTLGDPGCISNRKLFGYRLELEVSDVANLHPQPSPVVDADCQDYERSRVLRAPDPLAERRIAMERSEFGDDRQFLVVGSAVETLLHSSLNSKLPLKEMGWNPAHVKVVDTLLLVDPQPILARLSQKGLTPLGKNSRNDTRFVLTACHVPFKDDEDSLILSFGRTDWQTHITVRNAEDGVEHNDDLALEFGSLDVGRGRVPSSVALHYIVRFIDDTVLLLHRRTDIAHDAGKWSLSGEEQLEESDFWDGNLLRIFQRALCEEVLGLYDARSGTLQKRWDEFVGSKIDFMRLWGLVFEEHACVTSLLGFIQFRITRADFITWYADLGNACAGTRDIEGKMHWTTTAEIERLLISGTCSVHPLFSENATISLSADQLGRTTRYRAFRYCRAVRGVLPS